MVSTLADRLVLGTVQFGLDYGINNSTGKISDRAATAILQTAHQKGIRYLDSSNAYGDAEQRIGKIIHEQQLSFHIISKLAKCNPADVEHNTRQTFRHLQTEKLYGYMLHHFEFYEAYPAVWDHFIQLRETGRTQKIGFSLYHPAQLELLFGKQVSFDMIQVPYNVFDQRFAPLFATCREKGVEVHVRSIFLQGLFFKPLDTLPAFFEPVRNRLQHLRQMAQSAGISLHRLLLFFVARNTCIDKIVFGVDRMEDLEANANLGNTSELEPLYNDLAALSESNEQIILPVHWKL